MSFTFFNYAALVQKDKFKAFITGYRSYLLGAYQKYTILIEY